MNFTAITGHPVFRMLKATFDAWLEDKALRLSAALAYYSIFSIAPLLVIAISVAGLVLGREAVSGKLEGQLQEYFGTVAAASMQSMIASAAQPSKSWTGAVVGFVTLLLGASGVFGQLQDALNTIWQVKSKSGGGIWGFLRDRLLNFGMVLVIGFLLLTSLLMTTALAALSGYFQGLVGVPSWGGAVLGFLVSFCVVTALFAFIFKVLPNAQIEWRHVWTGAAVTALLFELGKFGLSFYLGRAGTTSSFGAAGSVVLVLLWVYYASCILLFGAEFTKIYAGNLNATIPPDEGAETAEHCAPLTPADASSPPPPRVIHVPVSTPGRNPLGVLVVVTAVSFAAGLLAGNEAARRRD